jgi:predicted nucleic-acid-binding protein
MKIVVDTNVLLRSAVRDDERQARIADQILDSASQAFLTLPCLCEFVWVLSRSYKLDRQAIVSALTRLMNAQNMVMDRNAVESGIAALCSGADFADGVIAYEGAWLGGETFVSFDKRAVQVLAGQGQKAKLLS